MIRLAILLLALFGSLTSNSQTLKADAEQSKIGFSVSHMMLSDVEGQFDKFAATLQYSKKDFSDAVFNITIDAASINTDNTRRDAHLRTKDFFDVDKYPKISFESVSVERDGEHYHLVGKLTLKGISIKTVATLDYKGVKDGAQVFEAHFNINRLAFNIGKETSTKMVGDEVAIHAIGYFK